MVHQKRSQVATWANDTLAEEPKKGKSKAAADDYLNFDSDESVELSEEEKDGHEPSEHEGAKGTQRNYHPLLGFVAVNVRVGVRIRPTSKQRWCNQEGGFSSVRLILCAVALWLFSQFWGNAVSDTKGMAFVLSSGSLH